MLPTRLHIGKASVKLILPALPSIQDKQAIIESGPGSTRPIFEAQTLGAAFQIRPSSTTLSLFPARHSWRNNAGFLQGRGSASGNASGYLLRWMRTRYCGPVGAGATDQAVNLCSRKIDKIAGFVPPCLQPHGRLIFFAGLYLRSFLKLVCPISLAAFASIRKPFF